MRRLKVKIGRYKNTTELIEVVEKDHKITECAKKIAKKITVAKKKQTLDLEIRTVKELGFSEQVTTKDLFASLESKGLAFCPAEAALELPLQYKQSMGEAVYVLHEPIADSIGNLSVLDVERDSDGSWVGRTCVEPGDEWFPSDRLIVFRKSVVPVTLTPFEPLARLEEKIDKLMNHSGVK